MIIYRALQALPAAEPVCASRTSAENRHDMIVSYYYYYYYQ